MVTRLISHRTLRRYVDDNGTAQGSLLCVGRRVLSKAWRYAQKIKCDAGKAVL